MILPKANPFYYERQLPHYQKQRCTIFVTFCKLVPESFSEEARNIVLRHCLHDNGKTQVMHAAVVMPEHVHLLMTPMSDLEGRVYPTRDILKLIKGISARNVNKLEGRQGPVWQEESFDHVLRSEESFEDKLDYIRQNPVRRGLVSVPEDYRWLWVERCSAALSR